MDKSTAYQWFPELGETEEVLLGSSIGLTGAFAKMFYCENAWSYSRILPGSWVLDHSEFGVLCMDPEIFEALSNTPSTLLTAVEALPNE
jgi:hypothetical protein